MSRFGWSTSPNALIAQYAMPVAPATLGAWFRPTSFSAISLLGGTHNTSPNATFMLRHETSGVPSLQWAVGMFISGPTAMVLNNWYYLSGSTDVAGNGALYMNGALQATSVATPGTSFTSLDIIVGGGGSNITNQVASPVTGDLAWFSIWDTVLPAQDHWRLGNGVSPLFVMRQNLRACFPIMGGNNEINLVNPVATGVLFGALSINSDPPGIRQGYTRRIRFGHRNMPI